jgi:hypothetical protein
VAADRDAAQRPLGGIVGETDSSVVEEAREGIPALQHVIHRLGDIVVTREPGALGAHPVLKLNDQRGDVGPAQLEAFAGDESIEDALGVEDQIDPAYGLMRQR